MPVADPLLVPMPPSADKSAAHIRPAEAAAKPSLRPDVANCDTQSTDSSRPRVPAQIVDGRFDVYARMGSGSYSDVHLGRDRMNGDEVAIKFEWSKAEKTGKLLAEAKLCQSLPRRIPRPFTPVVRWFGTEGEYNIMVMDVLGPSLEDLLEKCGGTFSLRTVLMLGIQMVDLLEYVHSCDIIHRDIKPHNFLIGVGPYKDQTYIVDFGLSKRYKDATTGEHVPFNNKKRGLTGTVRYTTRNIHNGIEPARRDDLGSVGFMLMYFLLGSLPWQGIHARSKKTKQRRIGKKKERVGHRELCKGFPDELPRYLEYCDSLDYFQEPNYDHLRAMLRAALEREVASYIASAVAADAGPTAAEQEARTFDWLLPLDKRPSRRKRTRGGAGAVETAVDNASKKRRATAEGAAVAAGAVEEARSMRPGPAANVPARPEPAVEEDEEETDEYTYDYESEEYEYEEDEDEEEEEDDEEPSRASEEAPESRESEEESREGDKAAARDQKRADDEGT